MTAFRRSIPLLITAVLIAATWWWTVRDDWKAEITSPPPYPVVSDDARPQLIATNRLPPMPGYSGAKPVVCADHRGHVLVLAHGITRPLGSDMLLWRSSNRGTSWNAPANLTNEAAKGRFYFDPWLETDRHGGFYFVSSLLSNPLPLFARSRDAGATWQLSIQIGSQFCDRPVLGVSPNGHSLVVAASLSERSTSFPAEPLKGDDPNLSAKIAAAFRHSSGVFMSEDQGTHWRRLSGPFGDSHAIPFAAAVDDSGRIAAAWIVSGNGSRSSLAISSDAGSTWTETSLVASLQPDRPHPFNGERFPVLAIDGESGLHVAYVTSGAKSLEVISSGDWTKWEAPVALSHEHAEEVRLAAIDARGPMVHVAWIERTSGEWHTYYCGSRDRGRTWIDPICVSVTTREGSEEADGFQILSDDDQSCVRDDGLGRVHIVWTIRGGEIMHSIVDWQPAGGTVNQDDQSR